MGDLSTVFQTRSSIVSATQTSGSAVGSTPSMLSQGLRVPFLDHLGIPPKRSKSGGLGFLAAHRPSPEPHEADHDRGRRVWCADPLPPDDELVRLPRRRFALLSLVILPVLPDQAFGPYGVWNARSGGWSYSSWESASAAISPTSFWGERTGLALRGIPGGLISSTATTV